MAVELHPLVGPEGVEDLLALRPGQLVQAELVVVSQEGGPGVVGRRVGQAADHALERLRVLSRERQPQALVEQERELHRELVAVLVAEEAREVLQLGVDLAQQHRLAAPAGRERTQTAQPLVRVALDLLGYAVQLEHEGHGVHAEARHPELQPEAHDLRDLVADRRVGQVQVGLEAVEAVQVVLAGALVLLPVAGLLVGKGEALGLLRGLVAPDVVGTEGRLAVVAAGLEPGVLVGGVVDDQVRDHLDAAVVGGAHQLHEVAEAAQARVHPAVVAHVVAVVAVGRGIERHQPEAGDTEAGQIIDLPHQTREVADAVAVGVAEGLHVQAVDDRVLPPQVAGLAQTHGSALGELGEHVLAERLDEGTELLTDVVEVDLVEAQPRELT